MSMAWEVTEDDVRIVLGRHGIEASDDRVSELHDSLDTDAVEDAVLAYLSFDAQVDAALSEIEDQLMDAGDIPAGPKQCDDPEDDDELDDDGFDDDDEDFDDLDDGDEP